MVQDRALRPARRGFFGSIPQQPGPPVPRALLGPPSPCMAGGGWRNQEETRVQMRLHGSDGPEGSTRGGRIQRQGQGEVQGRKEGEAETYGPIQRVSKREGEEKKGRKLSVPKREDEECPCLHGSGRTPADPSLNGCGSSGRGVVPGEMGLSRKRSLGAPHPSLMCCRKPQGPPPLTPETEGSSVPVVHTFRPHSARLGF